MNTQFEHFKKTIWLFAICKKFKFCTGTYDEKECTLYITPRPPILFFFRVNLLHYCTGKRS